MKNAKHDVLPDRWSMTRVVYGFADGSEYYIDGQDVQNLLHNEELFAMAFNYQRDSEFKKKQLKPINWKRLLNHGNCKQ